MRLLHLVVREISYRKGNFSLGVVSVAMAVAFMLAELAALKRHDLVTEQILAAKEAETRADMAALEDDYRKITKQLGFNVLILPKRQNMGELFEQDYASQTMPEDYVERLANARVATIQHLLPSLQRKIKWPEVERTILLDGVRGEVPILNADPKQPLLQPVREGSMVPGWELHRSLKLKTGDKVKLLGKEFTVGKLNPERGTKDDITVWINLREAQQMLAQEGKINGILALECVCAADSLPKVRAEITEVLPDTQVIEFQSQTLARAEARQRAAVEARNAIAREKDSRARLRYAQTEFVSVAVPLASVVAGVWVSLLAFSNVRERVGEIAILRALGAGSSRIIGIFLGRGALIGTTGAALGCATFWVASTLWPGAAPNHAAVVSVLNKKLWLAIFFGAPLLTILASWVPTWWAAQRSPAEALSKA